jgi:hypothetical protein
MDLEQVKSDLQSFADDDSDVLVERNGDVIFVRNQQTQVAKLEFADEQLFVHFNGDRLSYRNFISKNLARLDVFAEKIITKRRPQNSDFVNGPASIKSLTDSGNGSAMQLLNNECINSIPFATKVVFVTADAGHGKTALLKEYQFQQATRFLKGESHFIFWHVDLQGRQLLRLSEALMGDLGDLRVPSLWMSSIITLIQKGLLVLAIDGFDELAAEIGSADALGSLATLVSNMGNKGVLIAASRRTFFDTEDYLARAKMLRGKVDAECEFNELRIKDWSKGEAITFISNFSRNNANYFSNPEEVYEELLQQLDSNSNHPILVRPFLLAKLISGLKRYNLTPQEFLSGLRDPSKEGLASVIEAFIQREVNEKWRINDTGQPYLTFEQHMELLSVIAEEMWKAQNETISIDAIQFFITILCDEWGIHDDKMRTQIVQMVPMHALLVVPTNSDSNLRMFDHPEFKDYFIAVALSKLLKKLSERSYNAQFKRFLYHALLPETVAQYSVYNLSNEDSSVSNILAEMQLMVAKEWKPTYFQLNIGTLVPFLLADNKTLDGLEFDAKVTYSSLAFENKSIHNVKFRNGSFINTSFLNCNMYNVQFNNCLLSDAVFDDDAEYESVEMNECEVNSIKIVKDGEEIRQAYSPIAVLGALQSLEISFVDSLQDSNIDGTLVAQGSEAKQVLDRFLKFFNRATSITTYHIESKMSRNRDLIMEQIIPLMLEHGILEEKKSSFSKYVLRYPLQALLKGEGTTDDSQIGAFWRDFSKIEA